MIGAIIITAGVVCFLVFLALTWAVNGLRASDHRREG